MSAVSGMEFWRSLKALIPNLPETAMKVVIVAEAQKPVLVRVTHFADRANFESPTTTRYELHEVTR